MPTATATLPNTGSSTYTSSTPPALANPPPPTIAPPATPAQIQQAEEIASTPQPPPAVLGDFSAFEAARGEAPEFTIPQPQVAQVTPANTPAPNTPAPATIPPPVAPVVPQQTPTIQTGVDAQGNTLPVTLDLAQSSFSTTQQPQTIIPPNTSQTIPANLPAMENGRDMAGFTEDERKEFRQMSNSAFALVAPIYRAQKELKPQLDQARNEATQLKQQLQQKQVDPLTAVNPHGYIFTPEFAQITRGQQAADFENNYWQQQLATLREGKVKPRALAWNGQQYVAGQELEATPQTEALITNNLMSTNGAKQQWQQAESQLRVNYQQQAQQDIVTIKQLEDRYFPWFMEGKQHSFGPVIDGVIKQLPPTQQASPLARIAGKAYALIQHLTSEVNRLKGTASASQQQQQNPIGVTSGNTSVAGPGVNGATNGMANSTNGLAAVTMNDFESVRNGE